MSLLEKLAQAEALNAQQAARLAELRMMITQQAAAPAPAPTPAPAPPSPIPEPATPPLPAPARTLDFDTRARAPVGREYRPSGASSLTERLAENARTFAAIEADGGAAVLRNDRPWDVRAPLVGRATQSVYGGLGAGSGPTQLIARAGFAPRPNSQSDAGVVHYDDARDVTVQGLDIHLNGRESGLGTQYRAALYLWRPGTALIHSVRVVGDGTGQGRGLYVRAAPTGTPTGDVRVIGCGSDNLELGLGAMFIGRLSVYGGTWQGKALPGTVQGGNVGPIGALINECGVVRLHQMTVRRTGNTGIKTSGNRDVAVYDCAVREFGKDGIKVSAEGQVRRYSDVAVMEGNVVEERRHLCTDGSAYYLVHGAQKLIQRGNVARQEAPPAGDPGDFIGYKYTNNGGAPAPLDWLIERNTAANLPIAVNVDDGTLPGTLRWLDNAYSGAFPGSAVNLRGVQQAEWSRNRVGRTGARGGIGVLLLPGGTVLRGGGNEISGFDVAYHGAPAMPGLVGDRLTVSAPYRT